MSDKLTKLEERADVGKGNVNFVQVSRSAMAAHRELNKESPCASNILSLFAEHMDRSNVIVASNKMIGELTGYSRSSVTNAIKVLERRKFVQIVKIGNINSFVVNSRVFWTSGRDKLVYSKFHATVLASASEQSASVTTMNAIELNQVPTLHSTERAILSDEELPPPDQTDLDLN